MVVNLEIKFIFLYLLHKKIGCFEVKDPMFLYFPSRFTTITSRNISVTSSNFEGCGFAGITD